MGTRTAIRLIRKGKTVEVDGFAPTDTLLDHLRITEGAVGTKEGCCEGDCGACTIALGRLRDGRLVYEPVNACITLLGMADGAEIVTVEDIGHPDDPHPIQECMARHHASQCGFCTPGIVMALFCLFHERKAPGTRAVVNEWLAGNLCRCTGYRPIVDAAIDALSRPRDDAFSEKRTKAESLLQSFDDAVDLVIELESRFFAAPSSIDALAKLYGDHPDATLVAGATDVGLWITKALKDMPKVIWLGRVAGLDRIEQTATSFLIGAACTYSDAEDIMASIDPDLAEIWRRIGSKQVRASGTIGGNIANGSPIGDTPPPLIALGAKLELRRGEAVRAIPLEEFFLEYGRQDIEPGEFVSGILLPKPAPDRVFRCHKISKRFDQDISSVLGAFSFTLRDGVLSDPILAYGGMAGTPKRARKTEAALDGVPADDAERLQAALRCLEEDFRPLDDHRASAEYRLDVAKALLGKALAEIGGVTTDKTRLRGFREAEPVDG